MKRNVNLICFMLLVVVSTILSIRIKSTSTEPQLSEIQLANVEALSDDVEIVQGWCDKYCWSKAGYICILETNVGMIVNCDEAVPWNYFPGGL